MADPSAEKGVRDTAIPDEAGCNRNAKHRKARPKNTQTQGGRRINGITSSQFTCTDQMNVRKFTYVTRRPGPIRLEQLHIQDQPGFNMLSFLTIIASTKLHLHLGWPDLKQAASY